MMWKVICALLHTRHRVSETGTPSFCGPVYIHHSCRGHVNIRMVTARGKYVYKRQTAVVRRDGHGREASVGKGVRQGASLSPMLFSVHIEQAVKESTDGFGMGSNVQGDDRTTLRVADGSVMLPETAKDLEERLNGMDSVLRGMYTMDIDKSKTKVMEVRSSRIRRCRRR